MPAPNQGSRVALVTWTVLASILAVAMTIVTIYFYVDSSKTKETSEDTKKKLEEVVTLEMMRSQGDDLEKLRAARSDTDRGMETSMKLLNVAMTERNQLAKLIGSDNDATAYKSAKALIEKVKASDVKPADDSLMAAVTALLARVDALKAEAANSATQAGALAKQLADAQASANAQIQKVNQSNESLRGERDAAQQQVQTVTSDQRGGFENASAELKKQLEAVNEQVTQLNTQAADLSAQLKTKDTLIAQLEDKLGEKRVDPSRTIMQQPDGKILKLYPGDTCSIDLGTNDHITAGLTFEVYDKAAGIPSTEGPNADAALPIGKASIEVTAAEPTYSMCRIKRRPYGTAIAEGDIIANLVYDRNTKYKFVVHGAFDLDQNGIATAADGEVIKRLVTQWGGEVVDEINVDTDFVVMGKEPEIPEKPAEDAGPLEIARWNDAVAGKNAYDAMRDKALAYRLPLLNQNKFLYFVGYYNESKR
jgi:hypothetical protein